jgi:hypothetical protein
MIFIDLLADVDMLLPGGRSKAVFSLAKAKRDYQAQVYSDQMVLAIVRREAGPVAWWPKTLK